MLIKVVAFQGEIGKQLTLEEKIYIFKQRPDFVCLPEYYLLYLAVIRAVYLSYLGYLCRGLGGEALQYFVRYQPR